MNERTEQMQQSQSSRQGGTGKARRGGRARRMLAAALILSLLLAGVALAAKKAPKAGVYTGTSSERSPVTLKVSKGGTSIEGFTTTIGYDGKCGQGGGPGFEPKIAKAPIKHGRFSVTLSFKGEVPSIPAKHGKVTGRFSGSEVTGIVVIPSLKTKSGCLSYSETYSASWAHK